LGGCLKLSQTLGEYALQRCLVGDTSSVVLARNVVDALNGELVLFDFRNGKTLLPWACVESLIKCFQELSGRGVKDL